MVWMTMKLGNRQLNIGVPHVNPPISKSGQTDVSCRSRYNGRMTDPPSSFPSEMEEACRIVERVVNEEMRKRTRFNLEWGGGTDGDPLWRANVAASNCYQ